MLRKEHFFWIKSFKPKASSAHVACSYGNVYDFFLPKVLKFSTQSPKSLYRQAVYQKLFNCSQIGREEIECNFENSAEIFVFQNTKIFFVKSKEILKFNFFRKNFSQKQSRWHVEGLLTTFSEAAAQKSLYKLLMFPHKNISPMIITVDTNIEILTYCWSFLDRIPDKKLIQTLKGLTKRIADFRKKLSKYFP